MAIKQQHEVTRSIGHQRELANLVEDLQEQVASAERLRDEIARKTTHPVNREEALRLLEIRIEKIRRGLERLRAEI